MSDLPTQRDPKIDEAIDLYVEWLNVVNPMNDPTFDYEYSPADFLKYPIDTLIDAIDAPRSRSLRILCFEMTDADEGGPTTLTLFIDTEADEIDAIVQHFDTFYTQIYDRSSIGLIFNPLTLEP